MSVVTLLPQKGRLVCSQRMLRCYHFCPTILKKLEDFNNTVSLHFSTCTIFIMKLFVYHYRYHRDNKYYYRDIEFFIIAQH